MQHSAQAAKGFRKQVTGGYSPATPVSILAIWRH